MVRNDQPSMYFILITVLSNAGRYAISVMSSACRLNSSDLLSSRSSAADTNFTTDSSIFERINEPRGRPSSMAVIRSA